MIEVEITNSLSPAQVDQLLAFYDDVWWAKGRTREGVETMLAGWGMRPLHPSRRHPASHASTSTAPC